MAENTISLSFRGNEDMRAFVDAMSPAVGGSISLVVTVGVTEYDESRLNGVITNIDRDPYQDFQPEESAEEFAGETEPGVNQFEGSGYADAVPFAEDMTGMADYAEPPPVEGA